MNSQHTVGNEQKGSMGNENWNINLDNDKTIQFPIRQSQYGPWDDIQNNNSFLPKLYGQLEAKEIGMHAIRPDISTRGSGSRGYSRASSLSKNNFQKESINNCSINQYFFNNVPKEAKNGNRKEREKKDNNSLYFLDKNESRGDNCFAVSPQRNNFLQFFLSSKASRNANRSQLNTQSLHSQNLIQNGEKFIGNDGSDHNPDKLSYRGHEQSEFINVFDIINKTGGFAGINKNNDQFQLNNIDAVGKTENQQQALGEKPFSQQILKVQEMNLDFLTYMKQKTSRFERESTMKIFNQFRDRFDVEGYALQNAFSPNNNGTNKSRTIYQNHKKKFFNLKKQIQVESRASRERDRSLNNPTAKHCIQGEIEINQNHISSTQSLQSKTLGEIIQKINAEEKVQNIFQPQVKNVNESTEDSNDVSNIQKGQELMNPPLSQGQVLKSKEKFDKFKEGFIPMQNLLFKENSQNDTSSCVSENNYKANSESFEKQRNLQQIDLIILRGGQLQQNKICDKENINQLPNTIQIQNLSENGLYQGVNQQQQFTVMDSHNNPNCDGPILKLYA